jgi:hypothetical protein
MTKKNRKDTRKVYQLSVIGTLKEDWQDWFNGQLISTEGFCQEHSSTSFT